MLRKIITIFILLGVGTVKLSLSQEINLSTASIQEPEIKIEKIFERTFDEDIEDVVFGKAKMTVKKAIAIGYKGLEKERPDKEIEVDYPKVIKTNNKVVWLNKNGGKVKELSLEKYGKPYEIDGVHYFNESKILHSGRILIENKVYGNLFNLFAYDDQGNFIWSRYNTSILPQISESEKYIITGKANKVILCKISGEELWSREISQSFQFATFVKGKGNEYIILFEKDKVTLVDIYGNTEWVENIEINTLPLSITDVLSTRNCEIVMYTCIKPARNIDELNEEVYVLYAFNHLGKLTWAPKKTIGFKSRWHKFKISSDSKYLAGLTLWDNVWVMDINTGEIIWKKDLKNFNINIKNKNYNLDLSEDGKYLILTGIVKKSKIGKSEKDDFILLSGQSGKILKRDFIPRGKFLTSDKLLSTKARKIRIYKLRETRK